MDPFFLMTQMKNHAKAIQELAIGVSEEQARWKPAPESWSILEVSCHLLDEEREDFRVRLDCILKKTGQPWPPIDPKGWVKSRSYNQRDLSSTLKAFADERSKSLVWLKDLQNPDWQASVTVPFGKFYAGGIFAAWAAHDLLHLRQLIELHWDYLVNKVKPHLVDYAGEL